jgi:DNA-binding protein YbaB
MSGPIFGGDAKTVNARLDDWVAAARAKAERYQDVAARTRAVSVTETSRDGLVTVSVDANGTVTDLTLTDRVRDLSGQQVATAVLRTIQRANARIPDRIAELMRAAVGDDPATIDAVLANYRARFPEPEPEPAAPEIATELRIGQDEQPDEQPAEPPAAPPEPAPRPRPEPPRDDNDDDWEGPTILR